MPQVSAYKMKRARVIRAKPLRRCTRTHHQSAKRRHPQRVISPMESLRLRLAQLFAFASRQTTNTEEAECRWWQKGWDRFSL